MKEISLSGLTIVSPLAFPLTLKSGEVIETVGDAASYFGTLTEEKRESLMAGASGEKIVHRYRKRVAANAKRLSKLNSGRRRKPTSK